jgi:hypothetical protein
MRFLALLSLLMTVMVGCKETPDPNDLVENMVVQTTFKENTDFGFYNSFTLSLDTLGLYANWTDDTLFFDSDGYAHNVTNKIKNEMAANGYTYLDKDQDPDLGFAVTVFDNYNVYQQISYPTYYSGYYGYGYGGYYGPLVTTYEYSSSTLVIHLLDLKNRDAEQRLQVIWKAYIGDLTQSNDPEQKVLDAIRQAFDQSPYLAKP